MQKDHQLMGAPNPYRGFAPGPHWGFRPPDSLSVHTKKFLILYYGPMTLVSFLMVNFSAKFQREPRERGRRMRDGYEK